MEILKKKKIVVLDTDDPKLLNNNIFNPEVAKKISHTMLPTCYLYNEALKQDIYFITPDIYFKSPNEFTGALLISGLQSSLTDTLIKSGVKPIILTCQESPFIATRFYTQLLKYTSRYKHSFMFSGMKRLVSKKTIYHQMYFPQPYSINDFKPKKFNEKKMFVLVSGAKFVKNWWKKILIKIIYGFSIKDIYDERQKIIKYFSQKDGFDLYGFGWDKSKELNSSIIKKVYRGVVDDKFEKIREYKFTFCLENTIFPGYVTEKILDAIFAGSIPIYYGAPDIKQFIPKEVFIDIRDFKDYDALYSYVSTMGEQKYNTYLKAMEDFIKSEKYKKFSQEQFAKEILEILNKEFNNL